MNIKKVLESGHHFGAGETHLLFKFRVLNYFMMVAVVFGSLIGGLGIVDIMKIGAVQPVVILLDVAINIFLILYLRLDKKHYTLVAWSLVISTLMLHVSALISVETDEARVVWFYIAVYASYMLLGARNGMIFTAISMLVIIFVSIFVDLHITETAIATFLFALLVLSLLARAHAIHIAGYEQKLEEQNFQLENNISQLDMALETAQSASQVKSLFLANMSHEIRTPMNGVLSMVQVLENTSLDNQQQNYLTLIKRSGDSLLVLIDDLLDLSKIESGTFSLRPHTFNTLDMINDVLIQVEPFFNEPGVHFKTNITNDLPESLYGDAVRLKQVILNLISNAAKFTPDGKVELVISGSLIGHDFHLMIEVNDNGIGIPKGKLKNIFESFQQLSEDRIANKGVGLGLPICKKIIEEMDGFINVASTESLGSRFIVNLTLPVVSEEAGLVEEPVKLVNDKLRILVFEDDKISSLAVSTLLNGIGHAVVIAENGKVGVELLQKEKFDVLLMDIHMPVMNGVEATRFIKEMKLTDAPIIGMTASVMNDEKESYFEAGLDALVEKPINFENLMQVISKKLA